MVGKLFQAKIQIENKSVKDKANFLKKGSGLIFSAFLFLFILHTSYLIFDGLTDEFADADYAIVFGNKVEKNGEPSKRLKARLDAALTLLDKHKIEKIIVSGAFAKEGFDEAIVMKNYLISHGISSGKIIVDSQGKNTLASTKQLKQIIQSEHKSPFTSKIIVISSYYHILRCKLSMKLYGINNVKGVHAKGFESRDMYSIVREFVAFYKYLLIRLIDPKN